MPLCPQRRIAHTTIVTLPACLNHQHIQPLRHQLLQVIEPEVNYLLLDVTALQAIDAKVLAVFVEALNLALDHGGDVGLLNPTPKVRLLLEITRLYQRFKIYADEQAALDEWQSTAQVTTTT